MLTFCKICSKRLLAAAIHKKVNIYEISSSSNTPVSRTSASSKSRLISINAFLGTVLWTAYAETSSALEGHVPHPLAVSFISGAVAGGAQAIVAAPAENVRLVLEGNNNHTGWSSAWKDVFLGSQDVKTPKSSRSHYKEAREIRIWMKDVSGMAGRGWNGWGWGFAKDLCGTTRNIYVLIGV